MVGGWWVCKPILVIGFAWDKPPSRSKIEKGLSEGNDQNILGRRIQTNSIALVAIFIEKGFLLHLYSWTNEEYYSVKCHSEEFSFVKYIFKMKTKFLYIKKNSFCRRARKNIFRKIQIIKKIAFL